MRPDPTVLAFDTSAAHCAAALLAGGRIREVHRDMQRGQAEQLMPLLEDLLGKAELTWRDLDALVVGVGPGNFTGTRIAVAAARGLALSLGIPAVGVSRFETTARGRGGSGLLLVRLPAPRATFYLQEFAYGAPVAPPRHFDPETDTLTDAERAAALCEGTNEPEIGKLLATGLAKLSESKSHARPAPLYVRPPEAALPKDPPPKMLP